MWELLVLVNVIVPSGPKIANIWTMTNVGIFFIFIAVFCCLHLLVRPTINNIFYIYNIYLKRNYKTAVPE